MSENKKMFFWNDQRISWYDEAAKQSEYHKRIVREISPYISKTDVIFDIACGLGYVSEQLSNIVKSVNCFDIDENAINSLSKRCSNINNLHCVCGDWKETIKNKQCDVIIMSYCNGIGDNFNFLKSIAKKYIIAIHLYKNKGHNFGVNNHTDINKTFKRRETTEIIVDFLNRNNISYEGKKICCEFGQPFKNKSEAYDFIKTYFKVNDINIIEKIIQENLIQKEDYFYLPNKKESGIVVIDTTK